MRNIRSYLISLAVISIGCSWDPGSADDATSRSQQAIVSDETSPVAADGDAPPNDSFGTAPVIGDTLRKVLESVPAGEVIRVVVGLRDDVNMQPTFAIHGQAFYSPIETPVDSVWINGVAVNSEFYDFLTTESGTYRFAIMRAANRDINAASEIALSIVYL